MNIYFVVALIVAAIGLVIAGRYLYMAWRDYRFGRERRLSQERRVHSIPVPMERRKRARRD